MTIYLVVDGLANIATMVMDHVLSTHGKLVTHFLLYYVHELNLDEFAWSHAK
jgi:hypothetical protein